MLIFSMGVSIDGYIADRAGNFAWTRPDAELFRVHLDLVASLAGCLLGRRLYETMLIWETDPSFPDTDDERAFAEAWGALPKVVFSRTLDRVEGNARLAEGSFAEEAAALGAHGDVEVGGAGLAAAAVELDLLDELRLFRHPVVVGGGTPALPPVAGDLAFTLEETRTFAGDVVLERYRRAR